jgi:hypothetical protein
MHQIVVLLLSWRILMVKPLYHSRFDVDQSDHRAKHARHPQDFYPKKTADCALAQRIKDTYNDVEKGTRGYKVDSIQSGAVCLACQVIAGKLVQKNRPTQVTGFVVDLAGKCAEGLQMNWVKYLIKQLELDYRKRRIKNMSSTSADF